jgi:prepilin-type N-terminal cleavage/methylation domain-containing protein
MKKNALRKGFTIIEIIVVIAIIAVLAAMIIPSLTGYIRRAKRTADLGSAQTIGKEANTILYMDDDAYNSFYKKTGSQFNNKALRTVTDNDGIEYKIAAIAKIGGTKRSRTNKKEWVSFETEGKKFCEKLNVSMVLGNNDINIPMKYNPDPPPGKSSTADTWALCYSPERDQLEVWIGDSYGTYSFEAMYCLYPYISKGY